MQDIINHAQYLALQGVSWNEAAAELIALFGPSPDMWFAKHYYLVAKD